MDFRPVSGGGKEPLVAYARCTHPTCSCKTGRAYQCGVSRSDSHFAAPGKSYERLSAWNREVQEIKVMRRQSDWNSLLGDSAQRRIGFELTDIELQ